MQGNRKELGEKVCKKKKEQRIIHQSIQEKQQGAMQESMQEK